MSYPIEQKLVVAVSSSALFNLEASDRVFREQGAQAYRDFQASHLDDVLETGVAFPFIRRFLTLNERFPRERPVEVVLLSRNSSETGRRVFRSIASYGLDITRAAFLTGASPFPYIPAFNASLFLTADHRDVVGAIAAGHPGGLVLPGAITDDDNDPELRVAFDFDGVIADDAAEAVFKREGLEGFQAHEQQHAQTPHGPGLLADLFRKLSQLQHLEAQAVQSDPAYRPFLRTAIITARSAPAHERVIHTLESWGVTASRVFFLGGMEKSRILRVFRPHLFFDDQRRHLEPAADAMPMVHVPFGVANASTPVLEAT